MSTIIRTYRDTDLGTCRGLWVQLTEWHRTIYDSPGIGGDDPGKQFDGHLKRVGTDHIWLAESNGDVVGMAGLIHEPDEGTEGTIEMEPIIVTPAARGTGVGRLLVEHVIDVARSLDERDLNVRVVGGNAEAIRFYHDLGFDTIGYIELFRDTRPLDDQPWHKGETIADRRFRV